MQRYSPGDVVLLSYPYTNGSETKRRPALVLLDTGDEDIVVARITSQTTDASFDAELSDWRLAGLLLPSVVRLHKLVTVAKYLVKRRMGSLSPADWRRSRTVARSLWADVLLL